MVNNTIISSAYQLNSDIRNRASCHQSDIDKEMKDT